MASYLQDGVGQFPQEQPFVPNYNFIMRTLEMRQNQYDQGFAQIKSQQSSILNAELLRETNKEKRDQILANANRALKDLPMVDLSNPKNVSAAVSVFKPFYEDVNILNDLSKTKSNKSEITKGMSLRDAAKEEDRKRFFSESIEDLMNWQEEFKNATDDEALNMNTRRYVNKPQTAERFLELFEKGKLKRSVDKVTGQYKYTDENGRESIVPFTNLFMSMAQGDPEEMEGYQVIGRVQRTRYIKESVKNGLFPSEKDAATAHDNALVKNYVTLQDSGLRKSQDAKSILQAKVNVLTQKLNNGTISESELNELAQDNNDLNNLNNQINQYTANKAGADQLVKSNPSKFLGMVYLNKIASDMAYSLSAATYTRKIETNPIYEKFVHPYNIKKFETDEQIRLEQEKTRLDVIKEREKAAIKEAYGGGDGSSSSEGGSSTKKVTAADLNVPEISVSTASAGVTLRDEKGRPDAYQQNIDNKNDIVRKYTGLKNQFIFDVLDASDLVDKSGKPLDQAQMRDLPQKNPDLFMSLYNKAVNKLNQYQNADYGTPAHNKFDKYSRNLREINQLNNVWLAYDKYNKDRLDEIQGYIESTETHPEKIIKKRESVGRGGVSGGGEYKTVEEKIPGKDEGWIYKYLRDKDGLLLSNRPDHVDKFIKAIQKDKKFDNLVNNKYLNLLSSYTQPNLLVAGANIGKVFSGRPTMEQVKTAVINELKENFNKFRNKYTDIWNERGYNMLTQYAPIAGGGGTYAERVVTYRTSSDVKGEEGEKITQDVLTNLGGLGGNDVFAIYGKDKPGFKESQSNSKLVEALQPNGFLYNQIMQSNIDKGAPLSSYGITIGMVGGSNPNLHSYHISFDANFIDKMSKMKDKNDKPLLEAKGLSTADLLNGVTIYVNKDKDKSGVAAKSNLSEIDILLNSSTGGRLQEEVAKGFSFEIFKNPTGSGYKLRRSYIKTTPKLDANGQTTLVSLPETLEEDVPSTTNITSFYYQSFDQLMAAFNYKKQVEKQFAEAAKNRKVFTQADLDRKMAELQQGN